MTKPLSPARKANRAASRACIRAVDLTLEALDLATTEDELIVPKHVVSFFWKDAVIVVARDDQKAKLVQALREDKIAEPQYPRPLP